MDLKHLLPLHKLEERDADHEHSMVPAHEMPAEGLPVGSKFYRMRCEVEGCNHEANAVLVPSPTPRQQVAEAVEVARYTPGPDRATLQLVADVLKRHARLPQTEHSGCCAGVLANEIVEMIAYLDAGLLHTDGPEQA